MNWLTTTVSHVLLKSDSGAWGEEDNESGISVLRSTNMRNDGTINFSNLALRAIPVGKRRTKLLVFGDILLENSGGGPRQPVGRVCFFEGDTRDHVVGNFCRRLRPNPKLVLPKFLFWNLFYAHATGETLRFQTQTTGIRNLQFRGYSNRPFSLPTISEQARIVELLDEANQLRQLHHEVDAKAARILSTLFLNMFGDPATNPKAFPPVALGREDICEINPRIQRDLSDGTEVSFVPMADVDERLGRIVGRQRRGLIEVRKGFTAFQEDDVLFAKITPCMQNGKAAIARDLANGLGFGSTEFHVLRASQRTTPEWLFALVRLQSFRNQAMAAFTGTVGQQRVPTAFLKNYQVPLPPQQDVLRFTELAKSIVLVASEMDAKTAKVESLFSLLLARAFSGQLTANWRSARAQELLIEMQHQVHMLNLPSPGALEARP